MANHWDRKFLDLAQSISTWSKDRSTKIGCVIVGPSREIRSTGYNGMPRGIHDTVDARHDRPAKYSWFEHAERNAIYNAARHGAALEGCTAYMWSPIPGPPCADCARGLIQSGIVRVVTRVGLEEMVRPVGGANWRDTMVISMEMFEEAGIEFEAVTETRSL